MRHAIEKPYLLFLGDVRDELSAKTASGIALWRPGDCVGEFRMQGCGVTAGLPETGFAEAVRKEAKTLVVGAANAGGVLADHWIPVLAEALESGLDVASGLHHRLADAALLKETAHRHGRVLHDVRRPPDGLPVGTGEKRSGRRLLTVGTDCSVGKMYTSLALEREMRRRGMRVDFRATGQTGIFISGEGLAVDAVVSDFISGASELLSPANKPAHWDVIEGQGSLFHPSFAAVTLGLIHGSQPDALVMCHEPGRPGMRGLPTRPLPDLAECMEWNRKAATLTNPAARTIGMSFNTKHLDGPAAAAAMREAGEAFGMPCVDPVRTGVGPLVDRLEELFS